MATLEELQAQADKAQRRLDNARKRADEKLGKRLRELVTGENKLNREAQVERANVLLDELIAQQQREEGAQHDERQEHGEYGEHADGQQYGGSEYA